ncbi:hypothetical protein SteCoe_28174 [Stentor coeruleus]|uniref:Peptide deformylase n=1 Tax=Stentor coeruleus TaxID=5963 RepID=A0A1R2B8V3_9CILI|nr:hypothetical protein SteCoe_28174 [Stentor coeruleus]
MGLRILYNPSPILRQVSSPITHNIDLYDLISDLMFAIRYKDEVWTGIGLSICAVQIGLPVRVMIMGRERFWKLGKPHCAFDIFLDPKIVWKSSDTWDQWEGCLSIPEKECLVSRHISLIIRYQNMLGKTLEKQFTGTASRVIQHELDHFDGILMIDKAKDHRKKLPHIIK